MLLQRALQLALGLFAVALAVGFAITAFLIFDPEVKPFSPFAPARASCAGRAAGAATLPRGAGLDSRAGQPDAIALWLAAN